LTAVSTVASDPPSPDAGQVWYNTTDKALRAYIQSSTGSWATGGNLNTARRFAGGSGTQTAGLYFGGQSGPEKANTEQYDGTSWTEVNDMNTARSFIGAGNGTQTSALVFGGQPPITAITESWNGTNWTEVADMNTARYTQAGAGADNTSALAFGGYDGSPDVDSGRIGLTESWNGTSWTEVADFNTGRSSLSGNGIITSALAYAGIPSAGLPAIGNTESWNGTSWTEVNDLNTARYNLGGAGADNTSALAFGSTPAAGITESWNGTSWTEVADLSTPRTDMSSGGIGTQTAALAAGGDDGSPTAATEEWSFPNVTTDLGVS
jgi:hypothetical protein